MDGWGLIKSGVPSVDRDKTVHHVPRGTERIRLMETNAFQLGLATVPVIDDILRNGARRALQSAIEREVEEYIERNKPQVDDQGHRLVVRNGHHPAWLGTERDDGGADQRSLARPIRGLQPPILEGQALCVRVGSRGQASSTGRGLNLAAADGRHSRDQERSGATPHARRAGPAGCCTKAQ